MASIRFGASKSKSRMAMLVTRQRQRIEDLRAEGNDTREAELVLNGLMNSLEIFEDLDPAVDR